MSVLYTEDIGVTIFLCHCLNHTLRPISILEHDREYFEVTQLFQDPIPQTVMSGSAAIIQHCIPDCKLTLHRESSVVSQLTLLDHSIASAAL